MSDWVRSSWGWHMSNWIRDGSSQVQLGLVQVEQDDRSKSSWDRSSWVESVQSQVKSSRLRYTSGRVSLSLDWVEFSEVHILSSLS